jgi:O-antigen ligase
MLLGLASVPLSTKKWMQITWLYLFIISIGCGWSLFQYANNYTGIQEAYLKAKLLPTPADDDHIRFSWMVVTAVLLGMKCLQHEKKKMIRSALIVVLIFLIAYLHILAAKTGLVCLYLAGLIYLLYVLFIQKKRKTGSMIIVIIVAAAMLCYYTMPTLRNRIQYVLYDLSIYSTGSTLPGYNDAARWQSIRAGCAITNDHPLSGVGFGDMLSAVDQWHEKNHPSSFAYERFLPANEWLVYGTGSGWPGLICFTVGFFLLLYTATAKNIWSIILSVIAIIPFLIDDTLEGQYGVVVLAFIVFFGQQKLKGPPAIT